METTLFCMHIRKTAGMTLRSVIERQFSPQELFRMKGGLQKDLDRWRTLPSDVREKIRCVSGHFAFGIHDQITGPYEYFTVLRDPVDRVISNYYYVLSHPHLPYYAFIKSMSLEQFAEYSQNHQTATVSGYQQTYWFDDMVAQQKSNSVILEQTYLQARENIDRFFSAVGILEQFDDFLVLLKKRFGWRSVFYTRENVTVYRPKIAELPTQTISSLRAYNQYDQALYEYARKRFMLHRSWYGSALTADVARFQRQNTRWEWSMRWYQRCAHFFARTRMFLVRHTPRVIKKSIRSWL